MKIIADLHIHSRFSRACSKALTLENIDKTCKIKGIDVVATGDFTHPIWFKEMKEQLIEKESGLYVLKLPLSTSPLIKGRRNETRFICSTEISCIYSKGGKCRRIHVVILVPNLETVEKINSTLEKMGCNLKSDGRPIIGLSAEELAKVCFDANEKCMIIPAHIWTPWFAMFGSKSGFNSIQECWGEYANEIYAIETGISSDPIDSWRIKDLDRISITSHSDAHSLLSLGREANVFEINSPALAKGGTKGGSNLSYDEICRIIKDKDPKEFLYTIEFFPEEGRYHIDGHRLCNFSCEPKESTRLKNICPVCKKPLVIGVMNRVQELAESDRGPDYQNAQRVPFKKLIELDKIIAQALNIKSRSSKRVQVEYQELIKNFGTEFDILLSADYEDLKKNTLPEIVEGIKRVREGNVKIIPGFDGQYGQIKIFSEEDRINFQKSLF